MTLGEKLRSARRAKGLTVKQLSEKSGVAATTIRYYETDKSEPTFFKLSCLATALNLSLDSLAGINTTDLNPAKLNRAIQQYVDHTTYYIPREDHQRMDYIVAAAIELHNKISSKPREQIFLWE